ncbi:MAG: flocculation-associated PEP-CTERM protein PepA [Caldimonas sp.]
MKVNQLLASRGVRHVLYGAALAVASSTSFALPSFTITPAGASTPLLGAPVTADNIIISDFSTVRFTSPTSFTDTGYLAVQSFQLGGTTVIAGGLNSTYGLYFQFSGAGMLSGGNPALNVTSGNFTSLDYTLYGYNGPAATFGFDGSDNPTVTGAAGAVALAKGSLTPGSNQSSVGSSPQSPSFTSFAGANLSFTPTAAGAGFFTSPKTFYNVAVSSFINSPTQVSPVAAGFASGFRIAQGGGSVNFAAPIPEPETYALLLAGLGAIGWVARRRSSTSL